jgi:Thiamine pyrophosphate enzyme, N-terminal TPP binding domain
MKTVADQFAETLAPAGAKRIYRIVGDSLNGLTDALRRQGKIEWVHVRHEEGFRCQRDDVCKSRTADYDKNRPQAALLNEHQTNRHGTHAESRAKQTSDMSSKSSFRTAYDCGREAMRRPPEGARS